MTHVITKDPNANKDYEFDWREWLNGDTLASVQFILSTGASVQVGSVTFTVAGVILVWLSGGTDQTTDFLTCRITSTLGRVEDWTVQVNIRSQ